MPYNHNQSGQHKFDKDSCKARNRPEYDRALKNRGGQPTCSDIAVETELTLSSVCKP